MLPQVVRCAGRLVGWPWFRNRLLGGHRDLRRVRISRTNTTIPTQSTNYSVIIHSYVDVTSIISAFRSVHCAHLSIAGVHSISQTGAPNTAQDATKSMCFHRVLSLHTKIYACFCEPCVVLGKVGWSLIPQSTFHRSSRPLTRTIFLNWHDYAHTKHEVFVDK